jgi:phosphomannomutase
MKALIFDIDATLTEPRKPINIEMIQVLKNLSCPFVIAAGSDLSILNNQFFEPLKQAGWNSLFHAFICNGANHYTFNGALELITEFNLKDCLKLEYPRLLDTLQEGLEKFYIESFGPTIIERGSMINVCPIGRPSTTSEAYYLNRRKFVALDENTHYRQKFMEWLRDKLKDLIDEYNLTIMLGGETSFDIGIQGQDKTRSVHYLLSQGYQEIYFFGDALFENGNDAVMLDFINTYQKPICPLKTIQVTSYHDTIRQLKNI